VRDETPQREKDHPSKNAPRPRLWHQPRVYRVTRNIRRSWKGKPIIPKVVSPAALSLLVLIVALALSMTSQINVGWLALAFAWIIGV